MFVGREAELEDVSHRLAEGSPQFLRILGRRRVGKTELILKLLETRPGLYFHVDEADRVVQLEALASQVSAQVRGLPRKYGTWDDFLDHLEGSGQSLVVFDEFQHLLDSASGFASRLQDRWDRGWRRTGPSLLICGSSIGMMQGVAAPRTGPLYGRLTSTLHLGPMRYREVRGFYPRVPEEERIARYAVFGGIPYYHTFSLGRSLKEAIHLSLLTPTGGLLDEPHQLLQEELNDSARYAAILYEIGNGAHSLADLESKLQVAHGALAPYLATLNRRLDLVRVAEPLGGKKKGMRYDLSDPFFRFYYRFVFPNRGVIASRNGHLVWEGIEANLNGFVGQVFEEVVADAFLQQMGRSIGGRAAGYRQLGRWWNRSGLEIYLLALGPLEVWVGEVKWRARPLTRVDVDNLLAKIPFLPMTAGKEIIPFVVSRAGVTEEARDVLRRVGGFTLDMADLTAIFDPHSASAPKPKIRR